MTNPKNKPAFLRWTPPGPTEPLGHKEITGWYHSSAPSLGEATLFRVTTLGWRAMRDLALENITSGSITPKDADILEELSGRDLLPGYEPKVQQALVALLDFLDKPYIKHTSKHSTDLHVSSIIELSTSSGLPPTIVHRLLDLLNNPALKKHISNEFTGPLSVNLIRYKATPANILEQALKYAARTGRDSAGWKYCKILSSTPKISKLKSARDIAYSTFFSPVPPSRCYIQSVFSDFPRTHTWRDTGFPNILLLAELINNQEPIEATVILQEILDLSLTMQYVNYFPEALKILLSNTSPKHLSHCHKSTWSCFLTHPDKDVRLAAASALSKLSNSAPKSTPLCHPVR